MVVPALGVQLGHRGVELMSSVGDDGESEGHWSSSSLKVRGEGQHLWQPHL